MVVSYNKGMETRKYTEEEEKWNIKKCRDQGKLFCLWEVWLRGSVVPIHGQTEREALLYINSNPFHVWTKLMQLYSI